jgi:hypothetical protein
MCLPPAPSQNLENSKTKTKALLFCTGPLVAMDPDQQALHTGALLSAPGSMLGLLFWKGHRLCNETKWIHGI